MGSFIDEGWEWDFKWRRELFDGEMDMTVRFLEDLEGTSIHLDREDKWICKEDVSGVYTAGNGYRFGGKVLFQSCGRSRSLVKSLSSCGD